ncbi:hypothetical protein Hanom_Chr07g00640071 [Helianthus anomalus]
MVGVLCNSMKRFNQVCNVKWRNEVIAILVEEELGEWIPDCIGMVGEESLDDLMPQKMTVDSHGDKECPNEEVADVGPQEVVEGTAQNPDPFKVDGLGFSMSEVVECSGSKKKKRGNFRKKTRFDKSPSPTGLERPKKRSREGDDPFDIDRFIFTVQDAQLAGEEDGGKDKGEVLVGTDEAGVEVVVSEEPVVGFGTDAVAETNARV